MESRDLGSAITRGGGRRRTSSRVLKVEPTELMLEVERDLA